ncbi:Nif3-like dinuclear metal center hexameric protein [Helicobacter sp. 13S00477-4]|uniref:Nif3-like dinuclear metal center hexameric protein n=1 Tax=Helicobacter sp. 13S00477-4 TaxID=1905759 RepID=UPI000BA63BDA|nr:Nif3-like dinuclear metal center hexameric protein [Helicobacter sp. 13S00477-4]PAF51237.1 Nif3-like dinuclear metal center hexameric protein [Helicobacter sp. 13S00477-4]
MNKVCEIFDLLNIISPFELQENWDNSGLNLGSQEQEFKNIYACLEINTQIANDVLPQSLIITHHPLIFKSLKSFDYDTYPINIAKILIEKNCSLISLHTNFDCTHLNHYFAKNILGLKNLKQDGFALSKKVSNLDFMCLVKNIKKTLDIPTIKYTKSSDKIDFISVVCGAGSSFLYQRKLPKNSCLITGDIKYHDAMIAKSLNISLIDVEHYSSEKFFAQIIETILKTKGYQVIIKDSKNPFAYL